MSYSFIENKSIHSVSQRERFSSCIIISVLWFLRRAILQRWMPLVSGPFLLLDAAWFISSAVFFIMPLGEQCPSESRNTILSVGGGRFHTV